MKRKRHRQRCEECGRSFWAVWGRICSTRCRERRWWRTRPEYRALRARIMRGYRDSHLADCRRQKWSWRLAVAIGARPPADVIATLWAAHQQKPSTLAALARQAARRTA